MQIEITRDNAFVALGQAVQQLQNNKKYIVEIKEKRNKRSKDANAYCWVLLDKLAEKIKMSKIDIYRNLITCIGGNSTIVCVQNKAVESLCKGWEHNGIGWVCDTVESQIDGCTNVILYYGSSTYDTAQMSRLINLIVQECQTQGIETATPEEINIMLSLMETAK